MVNVLGLGIYIYLWVVLLGVIAYFFPPKWIEEITYYH